LNMTCRYDRIWRTYRREDSVQTLSIAINFTQSTMHNIEQDTIDPRPNDLQSKTLMHHEHTSRIVLSQVKYAIITKHPSTQETSKQQTVMTTIGTAPRFCKHRQATAQREALPMSAACKAAQFLEKAGSRRASAKRICRIIICLLLTPVACRTTAGNVPSRRRVQKPLVSCQEDQVEPGRRFFGF
jgi:hypothetical protein